MSRFKKSICLTLVVVMLAGLIGVMSSCRSEDNIGTVRIAALRGPTGIGMLKLMEDSENGSTKNDYEFIIASNPDEITGKIISGEVDVAAVPTNLASILYNRTDGSIQLSAVVTLGVLYLLENGNTINSVEDLRGKTIHISGIGGTPEFIMRYILIENGIDPDNDVNIELYVDHAELVALCLAGRADIAVLPEPSVSNLLMRSDDFRIALDITEEYERTTLNAGITDSFLAMSGLIVNREFAENNREVFETFMEEYRQSIEFVNNNIDEAAALAVKHDIIPSEEIAKRAIPNCNITFIQGEAMRRGVEQFFKILYGSDPRSIGGKLPGDDFYY